MSVISLPSAEAVRRKADQAIERMEKKHLINWRDSIGKVVFISMQYPGLWLEHTYDSVAWGNFRPSDVAVSKAQVKLFLDQQTEEGQLPCFIWKDITCHGWLQECVSFTRLALEACKQNKDLEFLKECYKKCKKWDDWLVKNRMGRGLGLVEMHCGYDTGHDNSGRLLGMKYPTYYKAMVGGPANEAPADDDVLPAVGPDINAVFYNSRMALADMAEELGLSDEADVWLKKAKDVHTALFEICYNKEDQFFYDVDKHGKQRKCKSIMITNMFSENVLSFDLGNEIFERYFLDPDEFGTPYPYPGVAVSDPTFHMNLPGNSWGYYSQGLTMLRSLRWMEKYGRKKELEENMLKWISAWCASDSIQFGQELDPFTGKPSQSSEYYSSTMIFFLESAKRLGYI